MTEREKMLAGQLYDCGVPDTFFEGSFWALLVVYVIAAWIGFWVESIIKEKS